MVVDNCMIVYMCEGRHVCECVNMREVCSWVLPLSDLPIPGGWGWGQHQQNLVLRAVPRSTAKSPLAALPVHHQPEAILSLQAHRRLHLHLSHPATN